MLLARALPLFLVACGATGLGEPIFEEPDASLLDAPVPVSAQSPDAAVAILDASVVRDAGTCNMLSNIGPKVTYQNVPQDPPTSNAPSSDGFPEGKFVLTSSTTYTGIGGPSGTDGGSAQTIDIAANVMQLVYQFFDETAPINMTMQWTSDMDGVHLVSTCGDGGDELVKIFPDDAGFTLTVRATVAHYDRVTK